MKRTEFKIATRSGAETRKGYVLGGFAAHKESGKGVYFWTFTHLHSGMCVNVSPPHETKASAIAHLHTIQRDGLPAHHQKTIDELELAPALQKLQS